MREAGDRPGHDVPRVAEDGDALADLVHLVEVMGDVHHRDALLAQRAHAGEQPLDGRAVEPGGRLVEDDEPGAERQRAGDLHELALLDGQVTGQRLRVDVHLVRLQQFARPGPQRPPVDRGALGRLAVEEEVLRDRERRDDRGLLVDAGDALPPRVTVGEGGCRLSREQHLALIGRLEPGEDRHQGGLTRAVPADERVGLTLGDRDPRAVERYGRAEALDDVSGFNVIFHHLT
ncbi:hypothetical protein GCM10020216_051580 [Nonomuraea helvata]